jgi:hypothetical protein
MGPVVLTGILGWGNGDRRGGACAFDVYGPGGRWGSRPSRPGTGAYEGATATRGDHLADALLEAGATEGTRLVVLALPRDTPDEVAERLANEAQARVNPNRGTD